LRLQNPKSGSVKFPSYGIGTSNLITLKFEDKRVKKSPAGGFRGKNTGKKQLKNLHRAAQRRHRGAQRRRHVFEYHKDIKELYSRSQSLFADVPEIIPF
jgi:hypothetical protein